MHYERVSLARRGGSWRMSYRAVYDAEHKGDRKWATICLLYTSPSPRDTR